MSSHREAPEISKDPVADSTDLYAFVSPDKPDTVTLIANYIPLEEPPGGPNFYEFGDDVLYEILIDNDGDGKADLVYSFQFQTQLPDPDTFLYNTGPITSLTDSTWNRRQTYSVTLTNYMSSSSGKKTTLGSNLACPPCNIGPLSTPDYVKLADAATHSLSGGIRVFAGQRAEGFYVDLGSIFDLGDLRPFQSLQVFAKAEGLKNAPGVNATNGLNVHSIAIQVPISDVLCKHGPVIGVWTSASRQRARVLDTNGKIVESGPYVQVSRLGNPLINEVIIPLGKKDYWNSQPPAGDKEFVPYYANPELAGLLPVLYPGVFPHLAKLVKSGKPRIDLEAILLTGIPSGIVDGFTNYTGSTPFDALRLNTSIPPTKKPNELGLLGGDEAGFPNGRRVFDDIVTVELRAIAGLTYSLVDSKYKPDAAAGEITDGLTRKSVRAGYLSTFPYLGVPYDGYHNPS